MKKCLNLLLNNGGISESPDGKILMKNTCSIDYFLIIIYIICENHLKELNRALYDCFIKIHSFVKINDWNSARLQWLKFSNLQNHIVFNNTHDWFLSEYESFYSSYGLFQKYSWKFECSNGQICKNNNRYESSTSFILR